MARDRFQARLYRESGKIRAKDATEMLLYLIARDHLPFGKVWELVEHALAEMEQDPTYTDGYAGRTARHLAERLRRGY